MMEMIVVVGRLAKYCRFVLGISTAMLKNFWIDKSRPKLTISRALVTFGGEEDDDMLFIGF